MKAIEPHLPVLPVLIPLFGALLSAFFRRGTMAWGVALLATWGSAAVSWWLLAKVLRPGSRSPTSWAAGPCHGASSTASMS